MGQTTFFGEVRNSEKKIRLKLELEFPCWIYPHYLRIIFQSGMIQGHLALSFISVIRYFTILGKEMYIKIVSFEKSNRLAIFIVTGLCHFKVMLLLLFKCRINSARVANSLILSKLWYVLQVVSATKEFLSSVVSLISGFISRRCFPRTSFDKMTLDRKSGSLGLLNPFIQQSSLQLRWLRPLLNLPNIHPDFWVADELQQSIVLPLLADYVIYHLELPCHTAILDSDYRLSFLFPGIRHSRLADRDSPMYLLFRAIDFRPKYFSGVEINLETTLRLLISAVVKPESTPIVGKSVPKLSVQDEYLIDPTTCTTRFRPPPH